jgi:deoxyuridine 5'-triphosphate nucleotidohydrolase
MKKIKNITSLGKMPVYDLTVENNSNYIIENTILHNCDYRGLVKVILHNTSQKTFTVERGMRIAQGVISPVVQAHFIMANEVTETKRGSGGFGSTGTK